MRLYILLMTPINKRLFGVKGWYKEHKARPGDKVIIETIKPGILYHFIFKCKEYRKPEEDYIENIRISKKFGGGISIVGNPINYGGLVYAPVNELGVVLLFGMIFEELGMKVEEIKSSFPDAVIRRFNGKGWAKEFVEFEYRSLTYIKAHQHPLEGCDIIICWVHDWIECPLEVIVLSDIIKYLPRNKVDYIKKIELYKLNKRNE